MLAPLVRRRVLLRGSARPAHRYAVGLDHVARVGAAIALVLQTAAGVAFARALPVQLPSAPTFEHTAGVPGLVVVNLAFRPRLTGHVSGVADSTRREREQPEGPEIALSVAAPRVRRVGDVTGRLVSVTRSVESQTVTPTESASRPLVLRVAVLNSLFALALVAARLAYHGHMHPVVYVAVAVVLTVYVGGAVQVVRMAMRSRVRTDDERQAWQSGLRRLDRLAARCPKVAMIGTVMGFLIAFSGSTDDVAQRVRGASTGLVATLIGIASMLLLELQHDWLSVRDETD